ncbi:MAG: hypothetical protein JWO33_2449, partial [Caulobacteraceae bacterium]|nr:hypothetical protein [Caulobacteraceae bacterium]
MRWALAVVGVVVAAGCALPAAAQTINGEDVSS